MYQGNLRDIPAVRLFVLMASFFVCLLLVGIAGAGLEHIDSIEERTRLLILSALQCIVAFCLPAYITARFSSPAPEKFLSLNTIPGVWSFIGVIVTFALALPALNWIIDWNQHIHLPAIMDGLETNLRQWEESNGSVATKMLSGAGPGTILFAILVIGILTGFSEELFFRGALQEIFLKSKASVFVAVWGTAIIFSALHFQFFGFIPRMLLGAYFGYLLVWSRSLWLPVFAHAFNNSFAVVSFYLNERFKNVNTLETIGVPAEEAFPWLAIGSVGATMIYLYFFKNSLSKRSRLN